MRRKWLYRIPGILLIAVVAVAILSFVVQHLWNSLVPTIMGGCMITFWQAAGILLLSKILFGGFRGRGGMHWRHRWAERWEKMSPEEREKFTQGMGRRCGAGRWQPEEQKI